MSSRIEELIKAIKGEEANLEPSQSRIEDIGYSILNNLPYNASAESRIEALLLAIQKTGVYSGAVLSRIEEILKAKLDGTEYTGPVMSRIEELLVGGSIKPAIYGFHVDPNIEDSANAVTYLADAVGMTAAKMGTNEFDYGSWKNAFFMPKPCVLGYDGKVLYYLDPNDYSKKLDGTPSNVGSLDIQGNVMIEWGKIWFKFESGSEDGEGYFYVSNKQVDETYHCWCNYDSEDNITEHFYTAAYNSVLSDGKFRSVSGQVLDADSKNSNNPGAEEITYATANNTTDKVEWYTDVYSDRLLINCLCVLMGKSLNTQAVFGRGLDTGGRTAKETYVTGTLDDKGLFWGVTTNGNSPVKVFGMENWWGLEYHRTAGCIAKSREYLVKLTYGTADGSETVGYNSTGSGYLSIGTLPSTNGYVSKFKYDEKGMMPLEIAGSASTYYADYFYQSTSTYYLLVGSSSGSSLATGAFYFNLDNGFSFRSWSIAAALSCKPLAEEG